jgi:arginase
MNNKQIFINNNICNIGQKKIGVEQGGKTILEMLENKYLIHNIYFDHEKEYNGYAQTYKYIYNFIDKYFILNLGGDHSVGSATVQPLLDKFEDDILIIWIDAHADINTQETSVTGNTHGMPVSCLFNLMPHWYEVDKKHHVLKPENLVYIGIRDLDPPEVDIINKLNIKYSKTLTDDILDFIKNHPAKKIHISFDIDGLDPELTPSTGTLASDGLTCENVIQIIDLTKDKLISMDVVEFNSFIGAHDDIVNTLLVLILY